MTPRQAAELLQSLRSESLTLEELHERIRRSGSTWSAEQLLLFLHCAPNVQLDTGSRTFRVIAHVREEEALQDAILDAVRSFAAKPASAAQVRARLPNHFVTTDEQVLAVARRTPGLEVFGPKLIRIAQ
jgi:hypothetical protein